MSDTNLHLIQVGFVKPLIEKMADDGIRMNKLFRYSGLNEYQLEEVDDYVPTHIVYKFLGLVREEKKVSDFFTYFFPGLHATQMSKHAEMFVCAPDLLSTFRLAEKYDQIIFTHERMSLKIDGLYSKFSSRLIDRFEPGKELLELLNLALLINACRIACGKEWMPLEIHLQHYESSGLKTFLADKPEVKVLTNQNAMAVVLPTRLLSLPMYNKVTEETVVHSASQFPKSLRHKIEKILDIHDTKSFPSIEHISQLCAVSSRSLQRKLKEEETSYSQLVEQWRLKKALFLLHDTAMQIQEIGENLGYSNTSNFERAFKRWVNMTPLDFRKQSKIL